MADKKNNASVGQQPVNKRIVSVSIDQINKLTSSTHGLVIHRQKVSTVNLIANVLGKINESENQLTFEVTDYTGKLKVKIFLASVDSETAELANSIQEQTYYRFVGEVRQDNCSRVDDNKPYLMIHRVLPLQSLNEITIHLLEVVYCAKSLNELKIDRLLDKLPFTNEEDKVDGLNRLESTILNLIKNDQSNDGINLEQICQLDGFRGLGKQLIEKVLKNLEQNEHIFETHDHHYKPAA